MKKYIDILTNHLREVAKCSTFSCAEDELDQIFQERRKEFLNNYFRKLTDKCNAFYQYFQEHDDYVLLSLRFKDPRYPHGDDPSMFKLYPFHVEVAECLSKRRATENLEKIETIWIDQLVSTIGEEYENDKRDFDEKNNDANID